MHGSINVADVDCIIGVGDCDSGIRPLASCVACNIRVGRACVCVGATVNQLQLSDPQFNALGHLFVGEQTEQSNKSAVSSFNIPECSIL